MMQRKQTLAVDAHVHLHGNAMPDWEAIARQMLTTAGEPVDAGALLLTEIGSPHGFCATQALMSDGSQVRQLDGAHALCITTSCLDLIVIAGRQVVTSQRLEVLLHGTLDAPADGTDVAEVLRWAQDQGVLAVLPWGFGKWTGIRRRQIARLLDDHPHLPVGDVPTRPRLWPEPLLRAAAAAGRCVLRGTDALPLPGDATRIGSFGQIVEVEPSVHGTATAVLRALQQPDNSRPYGRRMNTLKSLHVQGRFQWHSRSGNAVL
ncbi:hypothetical protein RM533_12445 [Croceicoccus sp. F390]|uniref:Amidohydrolase-related domain-containing protein n=1 Tax=Croceicoccus esteveae TaxID=3075597 RepID=A0ABU2ZNH0_9SPHN|nr:hypothetical protein [Croceicoccus sp. F390]MDT0576977.1 hypothetical protein [Croceicoccus sp. F390]